MKQKIKKIVFIFLGIISLHINAEEIRDYYSEPGLHPFKELTSDLNETIDPFSGTLQLRHADLTIPGNGGMDISISRFYTNHQDNNGRKPGYQNIYGVGWTMHYGRIVVPQAHASKICSQSSNNASTIDNPSLEHPDGARELLFLSDDNSGDLITKSNWRARCVLGQSGMLVISPSGTEYIMDQQSTIATSSSVIENSWYTSQIKDVQDNAIQISYLTHSIGYVYFDEVIGGKINGTSFTPDGRLVKFTYGPNTGTGCFQLQDISSNGRTWSYTYGTGVVDDDSMYITCRYNLDRVSLPNGQSWDYEYYPAAHPGLGKYSLKKSDIPL